LFDLGMKQLLRKCELRKGVAGFSGLITFIKRAGDTRLVVGDGYESVMFVFYKKTDNSFHVFADDALSRLCSGAGDVVDFNTCVAGDKFGNMFVLRLPPGATGDDPKSIASSSRSLLWDQGLMGGAPHKLSCEAHFHVGEMITSLHRTQMNVGKADCVVYTTILGSIGTFTPFETVDDLDFFALLELQMRRFYKSIVGRDHLSWRSYYAPCKNVVDGDLCEEFFMLEDSIKQTVAKEMDRSVVDIEKRIREARGWVFW
jgi:splicing factor 3B subunit 3